MCGKPTLEQASDSAHLFDHLCKLLVLCEKFVDLALRHAGTPRHTLHAAGRPREQLLSLQTVQLWNIHTLVRLTTNGTFLRLFKINFQYILARI